VHKTLFFISAEQFGLRLSPTHTNTPEFGTTLTLSVAAVFVAQSLAKTFTPNQPTLQLPPLSN
jgi:Na+/H+-dicarboxylate symporter